MTRWIIPLVLFNAPGVLADDEVSLAPIVVEGSSPESSPVDLMNRDFVLREQAGVTRATGATGSIDKSILEELPHAVAESTTPGGYSSFRGLGRSADETNVQVFGIGLNSPQGGGFDLSVFPQFLWSKYAFQPGPSLSSSDPRASAGTLSLVPWSATAISKKGKGAVAHGLYSDADLTQLAAGAWSEGQVGLIAGYSLGDARGPSGALSARWGQESSAMSFHLLGTRLDVDVPGSKSYPSPRATQLTARIIPVLQFDRTISAETYLKTSVFYDAANLSYVDSDTGFKTDDRIRQTGVEAILLWRDWRFGALARQVSYTPLTGEVPTESFGSAQVTRDIEVGRLLLEPTLQAVGVSRAGVRPAASFGARQDFGPLSAFSRLSYSWSFPTIVNRFYVVPGFRGNPQLKPESDLTWILGFGHELGDVSASLEGYAQKRWDTQVLTGESIVNAGSGSVLALIESLQWRASEWMDIRQSVTLKRTRLEATREAFPYQPSWIQTLTLAFHPQGDRWEIRVAGRAASEALTGFKDKIVEGYHVFDAEARVRLLGRADLTLRIENLFDESYEVFRDFPSKGRTFAAGVQTEL